MNRSWLEAAPADHLSTLFADDISQSRDHLRVVAHVTSESRLLSDLSILPPLPTSYHYVASFSPNPIPALHKMANALVQDPIVLSPEVLVSIIEATASAAPIVPVLRFRCLLPLNIPTSPEYVQAGQSF